MEEVLEQPAFGSVTFLNMTGDITITYDEHNKEKVLEIIRKKMKEGYAFFTTKPFITKKIQRKVKITSKNIDSVETIIITDEQFEKMCVDMNDSDVAGLIRAGAAGMAKNAPGSKKTIEVKERAKKAEDVVGKNAVAFRQFAGG